jgi:uncharacterized protein (DUF58 family)
VTAAAAPLTPAPVSARARPTTRFAVAFGLRFFVLLGAGFVWLAPAMIWPRLAYALVVWDAFVIAAWLVDAVRLPKPGKLTTRRDWSSPLALRVPSQVTLTLVNESASRIVASIVDAAPAWACSEPPVVRVTAQARDEAGARYSIVPSERGELSIGDAYIRYQGTLGLAQRWARAPLAQQLIVYPNLDEARKESMFIVRSRQIDMERRSARVRGAGRSFESLREHREGDEIRDICWTASARRGKLVTRQYEVERSQPIWLVVDTGRLMRARIGDVSKLDVAVNAALSLSQVACGSGDRVGLLTYGRQIHDCLPVARGPAHLRRIVERLARARGEASEADHLQAAASLAHRQTRRSLVVWITDLPDTAITPESITAASQLLARHLVLFVVIGQADLDRVAARRPESVEQMYETAAAQEISHRRNVLLAGLRGRGALVLEAESTLSPALVNAYLEIKQRNKL